MQTIVLASRKGGAGKTTLCRHLAVEAQRRGCGPIALIDTDPQGGLAGWWNRRQADDPIFIPSSLTDLERTIQTLADGGIRLVFVDTPPAVDTVIKQVIGIADLVIVPSRPSPDDLDAIGATIDLVEAAEKRMVFVINGATKRARLTGQAAVALSQHGTVAPSTIHHSVAFPSSAISGQTVTELDKDGPPALEIIALWDYIEQRLNKLASKPATRHTSKRSARAKDAAA